jgi:phage terminase small subunit
MHIYREAARRLTEIKLGSEVDTEYLISYAMCVAIMRRCEKAVIDPDVVDPGYAINTWEKAARRFHSMTRELGLSPAGRSGLRFTVDEPEPAAPDLFAS